MPVSESLAYRFLVDHCSSSASGPQCFKETLMFLHGTLGADGAQEAACSPRIVGRCFAKMVTKAPLKQSRVLSTQEVVFLEQFVSDPRNDLLTAPSPGMLRFAFMVDSGGQIVCGF